MKVDTRQQNIFQFPDLSLTGQTQVRKEPESLRYLLVHDWLPSLGGSETVFEEICSMYRGPIVSSMCKSELFPWLKGRSVTTSIFQKFPFAFWRHYIFAPWMPRFYQKTKVNGYEVLLVDSHSFAHNVPRSPESVYICYYHTSARSLWNPEIDDRGKSGPLGFLKKLMLPRLRRLDLAASKNPQYLIANSQTTANRVLANYGRQVDEIIYPPVSVGKWLDTPKVDDSEGFLIWGRLIGYKRIDLAIEAAKATGFKLNIVGAGPMEAALRKLAKGASNIVFHGRLPDDQLKDLMSRSKAVLFPGYEDFGIVPVEAMAAGLPVIAFNGGGAAETVDGYGVLLKTQTSEELADKMRQVLTMEFDADRLRKHAMEFDVAVFRERYQEAVRHAVVNIGNRLKRKI